MKILAFGYRRGCGKDTLCNMICRELRLKHRNLKVNVLGFADQLKIVVHQLYGWAGIKPGAYYEEFPAEKEKLIPYLPCGWTCARDVWIAYGNHTRLLDEGTWMNALLFTTTCDVLLIKDLRFHKELEAVTDAGGINCRIDRPAPKGMTVRQTLF